MDQLKEAAVLYKSISNATTEQNTNPLAEVHVVLNNHLRGCIRMPAGGAALGGSQQTGFELELITAESANTMFQGWPNRQSTAAGEKLSWELRSMEDLAEMLAFEDTGWGAMQGKPIPLAPGRIAHVGVILVGPPFTVCWARRPDRTTSLSFRFPLIIWSESDAVILPPDDAQGTPFYVDPAGQPGLHRDLFKTWGRRVAGELVLKGFPMSPSVMSHLPVEYQSDSNAEESQPATERSVSPTPSISSIDSSDLEGAHRLRTPDSSDEEGAHRTRTPDSSDEEGAHL